MTKSSLAQFTIDNTSVLVTGAGSGMGQATAILLAQAGAKHIFICGRNLGKLETTARTIAALQLDCEVHALAGDLTDEVFRQTISQRIKQHTDHLDALINNAGYFSGHTIEATSDAEWHKIYEINAATPFALVRELLPLLKQARHAAIVNIGSTLAEKPIPVAAAYNSAKAALAQLTRSLALELSCHQIRVNCIHPAIVETPMYRDRYASDQDYLQGMAEAAALHPLRRVGQPQDIANAVLFLISPAAAWITGITLPVDGGMLVT